MLRDAQIYANAYATKTCNNGLGFERGFWEGKLGVVLGRAKKERFWNFVALLVTAILSLRHKNIDMRHSYFHLD